MGHLNDNAATSLSLLVVADGKKCPTQGRRRTTAAAPLVASRNPLVCFRLARIRTILVRAGSLPSARPTGQGLSRLPFATEK